MHNKISDLVTGKPCEGFYLLSSMSLKKTSAGKTYLAGEIADATGSIPIVLWDYAGELNTEDVGAVVKVRGDVSEYREKKQVTLQRVRRATEDDQYDLSELVPCAPIDVEREMEYVNNLIDSMKDQDYLRFAKASLKRNEKMFRLLPAAKGVHHAFVSGLLMHSFVIFKAVNLLRGDANLVSDFERLELSALDHPVDGGVVYLPPVGQRLDGVDAVTHLHPPR